MAIAARHPGAADAQLALRALSHIVQRIVEHIGVHARHGAADGDRPTRHDIAAQTGDRAFGRAIAIDQPPPLRPQRGDIGRQGFPTDIEQLEIRQRRLRIAAATAAQQGGRRAEHAGAVIGQPGDNVWPQPRGRIIHHQQRGATGQCQPDFLDRTVIGDRRALDHAVSRPQRKFGQIGRDQIGDLAMLDHHPLGFARGARGIDQIGQLRRADLGQSRAASRRLGQQLRRIMHRAGAMGQARQPLQRGRFGQDQRGLRVFQDIDDAAIGERGIEAGERASGLEHGQLRQIEQWRRARQVQRHDRFAAGRSGRQARQDRVGQNVALRGEIGIADRLVDIAALAGRHEDGAGLWMARRRGRQKTVQRHVVLQLVSAHIRPLAPMLRRSIGNPAQKRRIRTGQPCGIRGSIRPFDPRYNCPNGAPLRILGQNTERAAGLRGRSHSMPPFHTSFALKHMQGEAPCCRKP